MLSGAEIPGGDLVLQEVRRAVREAGEPAPRIGSPARQFFRSLEPFLVDDTPAQKHQGRIARASLEPIWAWIGRDLIAAGAKTYSEAIGNALIAEDAVTCEQLTRAFQDRVADQIEHTLVAARNDEKARRRLSGQLGTARALEDLHDLGAILKARDSLVFIGDRLPGHIRNLVDAHLDAAKALLDSPAVRGPGILPYALIVLMSRLAAPWQLIRIATKAAKSDEAARVAATPYASAVAIVLAEIERMVGELQADLQARQQRRGDVAAQMHPRCRARLAHGIGSGGRFAVGPPARCGPRRDFEHAEDGDRIRARPCASPAATASGQ